MSNTKTGGLAGINAGETSLCTVGKEGAGLTYRGYDIYDLVDNASFEEVAYLLLRGNPPNKNELDDYIKRIKLMTDLPDELKNGIGDDSKKYTSYGCSKNRRIFSW